MSFFCERCDRNVPGDPVSEGVCTSCLMGHAAEFCGMCGDPLDVDADGDICTDCQESLDKAGCSLEDDDILGIEDEEFLRGPAF